MPAFQDPALRVVLLWEDNVVSAYQRGVKDNDVVSQLAVEEGPE